MKLVVAACAAGTDYQPNHPGKSFGTSRRVIANITEASTADILLDKVPFGLLLFILLENFSVSNLNFFIFFFIARRSLMKCKFHVVNGTGSKSHFTSS